MSTEAKTAGNALFFFAARAVDIIGGFLAIIIIARYLGITSFGEYSFIIAFIGAVIPIAYFGLERIGVRELSRKRAEAGQYTGAMLVSRWVLSLLAVTIVAASLIYMDLPRRNLIAMIAAVISELIWASGSTFICVFRAFEKMHLETIITLIYKIFYVAVLGAVFFMDLGFIAIFVVIAVANTLRLIMSLYLLNTRVSRPSFDFDRSLLGFLIKESFLLGFSHIFAIWSIRMSPILLNFLKNPTEVALFQSPATLIINLQVVPLSLIMALFPRFSRLGTTERKDLSSLYLKTFNIVFAMGIIAAAVVFAFSTEIIQLVFGSEFALAAPILALMALAIPVAFLTGLNEFIFVAVDRQKDLLFIWGAGFALNLAGNYMLIGRYGATGAAASMVLMFYFNFFLQWIFSRKILATGSMEMLTRPALILTALFSIIYVAGDTGVMVKALVVMGALASSAVIAVFVKTGRPSGVSAVPGGGGPALKVKGLIMGLVAGPFKSIMDMLPVSAIYAMGRLGGILYYKLSPGVAERIRGGLEKLNSFEKTDLKRVVRRCLYNYIANETEVFLFPRINKGNINRFVEIEGEEHLKNALDKGKGVILLHAHFGNAHMLMPALGHRGYMVNQVGMMPTDLLDRIGDVINRRPSKSVGGWLKVKEEYEKTLPVKFIYLKNTMRPLVECLKRNEILAISGDAGEGGGMVTVPFMGARAVFVTGPYRIAAQTGAEVLTGFVVRKNNGRHKLIIGAPDFKGLRSGDDFKDAVKEFASILEGYFKKYPCHYARLLGYDVPPFKIDIAWGSSLAADLHK